MTTTVTRIVNQHSPMLARFNEQDPLTLDATPDEFINLLHETANLLGSSTSSDLQDAAEELASAATYLTDALALPDDDPQQQTLLDHANRHLNSVDPYP
ncbi:hypothetical protein [Kitasatospora sp. NBC_01302]|uniref:hypothetical protein n=1 Tax=Kitasatospora sp. NBC_01302 TaxID=2903575 RepID=UPI002E116374|nr:hypothetical protein OG294_14225 [Kitasatospora sp. NBC_01302]